MTTIDQRIVQLEFDNRQFEAGIAQSRDSLGRFTKQLQLTGATKGLEDVDSAAKNVSGLDRISSGVDAIGNKFKAMSVVGLTVLSDITTKALNAGERIAKALTIDPIKAGFTNYETQIKATQTILANTASEGTKIGDVNKVLAELNEYANKTVYNFSEMTQNIGTFTAAGVKLKPAAAAIKGIANLAALSGSNSEQASTAMYQLSQAIAAGSVHLQDWNSVVNAGLGGKTFQTALENTARASGVNIDKIIKKAGSFRESLQKGWLTSNILEKTLSQFTGDLTKKQIESMGFSAKQAEGILKTGQIAVNAATQIKTFSQLTDALKEEVATAYASIFKTIFGNIGQATTLFTAIHNVAENALTKPVYALNTLLQGVDKLGGRTALIDAFKLAFKELGDFIKPIQQAFREIFPPVTAEQIFKLIAAFHVFIENLQISKTGADELKRTFAGVFAAISLGIDVVKDIVKMLVNLFESSTKGSSGILKFTASIGDWLVNLKNANDKGQVLANFFDKLTAKLQIPIKYIRELGTYVESLFGKFDGAKAESSIVGVTAKLGPMGKLLDIVQAAWGKFTDSIGKIAQKFEPLAKKFGTFFNNLGNQILSSLSNLNFSDVLGTINTGLFAGLILLVRKFSSSLLGSGLGGGGGLVHAFTESIDALTGTLKTMQGTLKAATLLEIAVAIGILALSISTLSKIDAGGLQRSVTAIGVLFGELLGSMAVLQKVLGTTGFVKLPIISLAFIGLAIAVNLLADAVKKLASLDMSQLKHGLAGLAIILAEMVETVKRMPPSSGLISTSIGLVILAAGIEILVDAVKKLSALSWTELAKGLIGVGVLLGSLALFTKFADADKGGVLQGIGLILLATGIEILAQAMKIFAQFSWQEIGKGLTALTGSLAAIGLALTLIPPESLLSAAAVLVVASSLQLIVKALQQMGSMSWSEIAKSLVELAGALAIIAGAMALMTEALPGAAALWVVSLSLGAITDALIKMGDMSWGGSLLLISAAMILMTEALPGAAALLIVAASLAILTPVLLAMGDMSWSEIGKSLLELAGVFIIFGVAGALLTPVVPTLIGLGLAITLIGAGVLLAGVGVLAFSAGLTALSVSGAAAGVALIAIVTGLAGTLPVIVKDFGAALLAFADVIGKSAPAIVKAIVTLLESLLSAIDQLAPKILHTLGTLLTELVDAAVKYEPHLVSAGMGLITSLLNGIAKKAPGLVTAAVNMVVAFTNAVAKNLPKIIQAGANLAIKFVNGVADAIRKNSKAMGAAGANLGSAMVTGMISGMAGGIGKIASEAEKLARSAISSAKHALDSHSPSKEFIKIGQDVDNGFAIGINSNTAGVKKAVTTLANQLITGMNDSANTIDSLKNKLSSLTKARHKDYTEIAQTNKALAQAEKEHKAESAAYTELTKTLKPQQTALGKLGDQYDALTTKITTAQSALTDAQKTMADFNTQITQQYQTLPELPDATTDMQSVGDYEVSLQKQISDTQTLATTLQRLRDLGLNDDTYKQLLAGGIADLPFAQQLLAGGKMSVDQINALDKQLDAAAIGMGKTASTDLYQAAVDAAAGLVKGLQDQQSAIEKQMEKIAEAMIKAINKKLGIKSPSKVLRSVGNFSGDGLVQGLDDSTDAIAKSASNMGQTAVTSLAKSLTGMSDLISGGIDTAPTITPILDLSSVKKSASQIGGVLSSQSLSVNSAYSKALAASSGHMSNVAASTQTTATTGPVAPVSYTQNNYSPKALSAVEIYRQTKNQISTLKEVVKVP